MDTAVKGAGSAEPGFPQPATMDEALMGVSRRLDKVCCRAAIVSCSCPRAATCSAWDVDVALAFSMCALTPVSPLPALRSAVGACVQLDDFLDDMPRALSAAMDQRLTTLRAELAVVIKHQLRRGASNPGVRELREPAATGGTGVDTSHSTPRVSDESARCSGQCNALQDLLTKLPALLSPRHAAGIDWGLISKGYQEQLRHDNQSQRAECCSKLSGVANRKLRPNKQLLQRWVFSSDVGVVPNGVGNRVLLRERVWCRQWMSIQVFQSKSNVCIPTKYDISVSMLYAFLRIPALLCSFAQGTRPDATSTLYSAATRLTERMSH